MTIIKDFAGDECIRSCKAENVVRKGGIFLKSQFFGLILTTFEFSHQNDKQFSLKLAIQGSPIIRSVFSPQKSLLLAYFSSICLLILAFLSNFRCNVQFSSGKRTGLTIGLIQGVKFG